MTSAFGQEQPSASRSRGDLHPVRVGAIIFAVAAATWPHAPFRRRLGASSTSRISRFQPVHFSSLVTASTVNAFASCDASMVAAPAAAAFGGFESLAIRSTDARLLSAGARRVGRRHRYRRARPRRPTAWPSFDGHAQLALLENVKRETMELAVGRVRYLWARRADASGRVNKNEGAPSERPMKGRKFRLRPPRTGGQNSWHQGGRPGLGLRGKQAALDVG